MERENPFGEMHKSVLRAGNSAQGYELEAREDAGDFSDYDGDDGEDAERDSPEEDPEVDIELNADDFETAVGSTGGPS